MPKKYHHPVVKILPAGTPCVYYTQGLWLTIRGVLVRDYLDRRKRKGEHRARLTARQPDSISDSFLAQFCEFDGTHTSLDFYRVGYDAYHKYSAAISAPSEWSPAELVVRGDREEQAAFDALLAKLTASPAPAPSRVPPPRSS